MAHDVFISHASEDKSTATAVCASLESHGIRCWIAYRDVVPGAHYAEALIEALDKSRIVVLIFSANSNRSQHVMRELERAAAKGVPIIPFRIDDVPPSKGVEFFVSGHQWLDALTPPLESHLTILAEAIRHLLGDQSGKSQGTAPHNRQSATDLTFRQLLTDPTVLIGHAIGPYLVKQPIAVGGSGLVYRGWDSHLGRDVCIKFLHPPAPDASRVAAASTQITRALSTIDHPNIVKIFDQGPFTLADAESSYIVMEFVEGKSLQRWIEENPVVLLSLADRFRIATHITAALLAAHAHQYTSESGFAQTGLLHGDIKPANIMIRPDGSPVVLDFGLPAGGRLSDETRTRLRQGQATTEAFGTPGFMAPEQAESGVVTPMTDVFGLGKCLDCLFFPIPSSFPQPQLHDAGPVLAAVKDLVHSMQAPTASSRPSLSSVRESLHDLSLKAHAIEPPLLGRIRPARARPKVSRWLWPFRRGTESDVSQEMMDEQFSRDECGLISPPTRISFGASAPACCTPETEFVARFVCSRPEQQRDARAQLSKRAAKESIRLGLVESRIVPGSRVGVRLRAPGARVREPLQTFVWRRAVEILEFKVMFPKNSRLGTRYLGFEIVLAGLNIASFSLDLELVQRIATEPTTTTRETHLPRQVFASYAHADKLRVLDHVNGVKTLTNIDVFTDCLSLRNGEYWESEVERAIRSSEKFWLFWSRHALASKWVTFEWKKALDLHGLRVIVPQALEGMDVAPPPDELSSLHFSDTIAHIRKSLIRRRWAAPPR